MAIFNTGPAAQGAFGGGLQGTSVAPIGGGGLTGSPPRLSSSGLPPGTNASQSQYGTGVVPGMMDVYNQLLGVNQSHYNNVLNAFQGGGQNLQGALPSINAGYSNALSGVMNTLGMGQVLGQNGNWGVANPAAQAIQQTFENTYGATQQGLINSGLGNTTAGAGLQNMNAQTAGRAFGALGANLAQTAAGYQGQFGMAQLAQAMQGLGMETGLTQAGLGPLGQQFSNTAGSLTGGFGASAYGGQQYPYPGRGGYGGGPPQNSGGTNPSTPRITDPYGMYQGGGYGTPMNQQQQVPVPGASPSGSTQTDWGFTANNPYANLGGLNSGMSGHADTFANANGYPFAGSQYGQGFTTQNYGNVGDLGNGGFGGGLGTYGDMTGLDSNLGIDLNALTGALGGF